jgi:hypothetical protein
MITLMFQKPKDTLQLIVHESDQPRMSKGTLIPFKPNAIQVRPKRALTLSMQTMGRVAVATFLFIVFGIAGTVGYGSVLQSTQVASPMVTIIDPVTLSVTPFDYGPQAALSQTSFFEETQDAFIDDEMTFIEVDLDRRQLRYFEKGVLVHSAEILAIPTVGSWWDAEAGLYQVNEKKEEFFSSLAQTIMPWTITFQENFMIHGMSTYPDGSVVPPTASTGGIILATEKAKRLFQLVQPDTPILVHVGDVISDSFVYKPAVPDISTSHYFIADLDNNALLAANDISAVVPIASLTKLMTAVVAAEELSLDKRVFATSPNFITSLIPRLSERSSVSMYSLLQLLLVESSNEAAEVIASELGREEFIAAMNKKARQLGMLNTTFADPSGLSSENVSTVGDLYRLAQHIDKNRSFIFGITKDVNLPNAYVGGDFSGLINFNEVEDVTGFVGGKVGETNAAGQTSLSLHELSIDGTTRTVVVIVLGSTGRTADVQTLVSFVENRFGE